MTKFYDANFFARSEIPDRELSILLGVIEDRGYVPQWAERYGMDKLSMEEIKAMAEKRGVKMPTYHERYGYG